MKNGIYFCAEVSSALHCPKLFIWISNFSKILFKVFACNLNSSRLQKVKNSNFIWFSIKLFLKLSFIHIALSLLSTIYSTGFAIISTRYIHSWARNIKDDRQFELLRSDKKFLHQHSSPRLSWMQSLSWREKWQISDGYGATYKFSLSLCRFFFFLHLNKHEKVPQRDLKASPSLPLWKDSRSLLTIESTGKACQCWNIESIFFSTKYFHLENCHFFISFKR